MPATPVFLTTPTGTPASFSLVSTYGTAALVSASTTVSAATSCLIVASGAGTVNLRLNSGSLMTVSVAAATVILPFAVTLWSAGTATVSEFYNIS